MTLWKKRNDSLLAAFSLFEAIIIMVIIGAIAGFIVPNLTKSIKRMKVKEAENILAVIRGAQLEYAKENNGAFADRIGDLEIEIPALRHHQAPIIIAGDSINCPLGMKTRIASIRSNDSAFTLVLYNDGVVSCQTCGGGCGSFDYISCEQMCAI